MAFEKGKKGDQKTSCQSIGKSMATQRHEIVEELIAEDANQRLSQGGKLDNETKVGTVSY